MAQIRYQLLTTEYTKANTELNGVYFIIEKTKTVI